MSLYLFFQKIKYQLCAKNRHGIHSPFVYHFVEKILNDRWPNKDIRCFPFWKQANLSSKQSLILDRICSYYPIHSIHFLEEIFEISTHKEGGRLLIYKEPKQVELNINQNDIVIILNPYSSTSQYLNWETLKKEPKISLSIDIYEMGILFFREEFLVKQHFLLHR